MSERKVLQKYYPPDFDPSKIARSRVPKNVGPKVMTVRLMARTFVREPFFPPLHTISNLGICLSSLKAVDMSRASYLLMSKHY